MNLGANMHRVIRPVNVGDPNLSTQSMVSRGLASSLGLVSQGVSRVLTTLIIGRLGGPTTLGTVASALSVANLAVLIWPASVGSAAAKFIPQARGRGEYDEAVAVAAHLKRRTATVGLLMAGLVAPIWALSTGGTAQVALLVGLLIVTFSGQALGGGIQYGTGQFTRAMYWDLLASFLGFSGVTILVLLGHTGVVLLLPIGVAAGAYMLGCWPWGATGSLPKVKRRELDIFVAITTVGTLTSSGFYQLSVLASNAIAGAEGAGQYAAALALATPLLLVTSALSVVLFPSLAVAVGRGDHEAVRRQTDQATRALTFSLTATVAALVLCSRSVVRIVWGEDFDAAAQLLPLVLAAVLVTGLAVPSVNYLANHSQRGAAFGTAVSGIGLVVGVCLWFVFVADWGVVAVAAGFLLGKLVFLVIVMAVTSNRLGLHFTNVALKLAGASIVAAVSVYYQKSASLPLWSDVPFALGFLVLWCGVCREDLQLVITRVRSARSSR